jgi:uncharacterized protein (TIGR03663 family)
LPLALIAVAAFWLRTHDLGRRPMHADEANQAVKTGELLETGRYAFDPRDHHGPTLYYAAGALARIRGERTLAQLSETTVRLVPAIAGTLAVIFLAGLGTSRHADTSRWPALAAALFLAVSPPAVYYSRYFVQETLLVALALATLLATRTWWRTGLTRWAVAAGVGAGLMQATKASAPLFLLLAGIALLAVRGVARPATRRPRRDAGFALLAAVFTAALLYSSFGTNLAGLRDALGAYSHAIQRFGADAPPTGHEKPWWYYLRLFGWFRDGGLVWHQAAFSALALAGAGVALARRDPFGRGVALYALLLLTAFSIFAYKTPWHTVHFVAPLALLAAAALAALARLRTGRLVAVAFALIVTATLFQQAWRTSFLRPADWRNPYAYVHSSADVLKYRALVEAAASRAPTLPIRVISEEYWPLPWYLRGIPNVGYWSTAPDDCEAALIIASSAQADAVRPRLRRPYRETFLGLRPGFVCILFIPEP